jgi:hypothetical protein
MYPGRFSIPPSKGEPSLLVVGQSVHYVDVGENRPQVEVISNSMEIARSIVDDFISAQLAIDVDGSAQPGLTWVRGAVVPIELKTKHADVVTRLRASQREWYMRLVQMADDDWEKYKRHTAVSDIQRYAAVDLGYTDKDWLILPEKLMSVKCPACKSSNVPDTIVCPVCRCILDKEKYQKLTFAT